MICRWKIHCEYIWNQNQKFIRNNEIYIFMIFIFSNVFQYFLSILTKSQFFQWSFMCADFVVSNKIFNFLNIIGIHTFLTSTNYYHRKNILNIEFHPRNANFGDITKKSVYKNIFQAFFMICFVRYQKDLAQFLKFRLYFCKDTPNVIPCE